MNKLTDDIKTLFQDKVLNFFAPAIETFLSLFDKNSSEWDELPLEYTPVIAKPQLLKPFTLKLSGITIMSSIKRLSRFWIVCTVNIQNNLTSIFFPLIY